MYDTFEQTTNSFFQPHGLPKRALNLIWGSNWWAGWDLLGSNIERASKSPNVLEECQGKFGTPSGTASVSVIFIKYSTVLWVASNGFESKMTRANCKSFNLLSVSKSRKGRGTWGISPRRSMNASGKTRTGSYTGGVVKWSFFSFLFHLRNNDISK